MLLMSDLTSWLRKDGKSIAPLTIAILVSFTVSPWNGV
jgi:hypothetical protein